MQPHRNGKRKLNYGSLARGLKVFCLCVLSQSLAGLVDADTLQVGPGKPFATPCMAIAAAHDGDIIEIDPVLYLGDVCAWTKNNLTLRGVNGRAHIDAKSKSAQKKGIWVPYGNNTVVENIEFSGARSLSQNGAGIRASGVNLTVRNCYFHDNEMGILESNIAGSNILIEYSEFARNGNKSGAHNVYIGLVASLTFQFNYSHDAVAGHLLKTRAAVNYILHNRLTEESGTGSYEIDIPFGGTSYVIGNLVQQGPKSQNSSLLAYLEEGEDPNNPGRDLYVINNTFVNDKGTGTFIQVGAVDTVPVVITNNIFNGPGTITNQSNAVLANNFSGDPLFVNKAAFDYHLTMSSPAINAGTDPGTASNGYSLTPVYQYVHPACGEQRVTVDRVDIGAYEYNGAGTALVCR